MSRLFRLASLRNAYLFRGVAVWVGFRLVAAFFGISHPNAIEKGLILGTVALAVVLDARRREEDVFLGNLGIRTRWIAAVALVIPVALELLVL